APAAHGDGPRQDDKFAASPYPELDDQRSVARRRYFSTTHGVSLTQAFCSGADKPSGLTIRADSIGQHPAGRHVARRGMLLAINPAVGPVRARWQPPFAAGSQPL